MKTNRTKNGSKFRISKIYQEMKGLEEHNKRTASEREKYRRAKKRVGELRGFYGHLGAYLIVNAFILLMIFMSTLEKGQSFWQARHFFTLIFWGIGLMFHAAHTFSLNPFLGKKWEQGMIRKFMEDDREDSQKFQ